MGDGAAPMEVEDEENVQGDPTDEFVIRGDLATVQNLFDHSSK